MRSLSIMLPWPDKKLSPNARVHPMALYRAKKKAKGDAKLCARAAAAIANRDCGVPWWQSCWRLRVSIVARPKDNRARDEDNLQASLKAALDGVAAALGVNDSRFRIQGTRILPAEKGQNPEVVIEIQPDSPYALPWVTPETLAAKKKIQPKEIS
jgi:crossover junction endodeoxyribonuclease RusA